MMPARWRDSVLEVLSIVEAAVLPGPATARSCWPPRARMPAKAACPPWRAPRSARACTAAYAAFIQLSAGAFSGRWLLLRPNIHPAAAAARRTWRQLPQASSVVESLAGNVPPRCCVMARKKRAMRQAEALRRRGCGRAPHRRGLPACGLHNVGLSVFMFYQAVSSGLAGLLGLAALAGQLFRAGFGLLASLAPQPAILPGGGAGGRSAPAAPYIGCRTTTEYPQAAPSAWRHPFPKPPLQTGTSPSGRGRLASWIRTLRGRSAICLNRVSLVLG